MRQDVARSGFAVFLGLAVVVPFLNYHRVSPSPTFYSEFAAAVFFLAACATGASLLPRRQAVDGFLGVFCLGLLALLSYQVASGGYYEFMMSWASWAAFLCFFFLAFAFGQVAAADPPLRALIVDRLTAALLMAALFNAFAQVAQTTEWALQIRPLVFIPTADKYDAYTCAPAGNVAQRNHANAVAWLGIASLMYALTLQRVRLVVAIAGFGILLFSVALTSSRMAWLMAAALAALLFLGRRGMGWSSRRALVVGSLLIVGLLAATVVRHLLLSGCMSSIDRAIGGIGAASSGQGPDYWIRLEMVRQAITIWWSQPILGVGVGKFMAKTFSLEPSRDWVQPLDFYPHNTVLEILVSFGIVGAALLLVCGSVWAVRAWRHRNASVQQWPLLAGLAILSIPALLEISLWYLYFLLPFGLMLGMAIGPFPTGTFSLSLPWRWVFPVAAVISAPVLAFAVRDHVRAEHVNWLGQVARSQSELAGPAASLIPKAAGELTLFAVWGEHEMLRFGEERQGDLSAQIAANKRLLDNIPDPHIVARQVMLETLAGRPEQARDHFRRLMVFFPEDYESLAKELRRRAEAHPDHAGALVKIIDEEMSRPPRHRG